MSTAENTLGALAPAPAASLPATPSAAVLGEGFASVSQGDLARELGVDSRYLKDTGSNNVVPFPAPAAEAAPTADSTVPAAPEATAGEVETDETAPEGEPAAPAPEDKDAQLAALQAEIEALKAKLPPEEAAPEAEGEAKGVPEGVQKRINELTKRAKSAEEKAAAYEAQLAQASAPAPQAQARTALDDRLDALQSLIDTAESHPEGVELPLQNGQKRFYSPEELRAIRRNATGEITQLAAQKAVQAEQLRAARAASQRLYDARVDAAPEFAFLKQPDSPEAQVAAGILRALPGLHEFANARLVAAILARELPKYEPGAPAPIAPKKPSSVSTPPVAPRVAALPPRSAPVAPRTAKTAAIEQARAKLEKSGSTDALAAYFAATG